MPDRVKSTQQKALNRAESERLQVSEAQETAAFTGNQALQQALTGQAPTALRAVQGIAGNQALQRVAQGAATGEADLGERIRQAAGKGQSLDGAVQTTLQTAMGADLSGVRVHTDGEADQMSRSVGALAFTTGSDIFFSQGAYDPSSTEGMRTLAHEATHVVQQSAGPVAGTQTDMGVAVSDPSDRFEREAEARAEAVLASGALSGASAAAPVQGRSVQRAEEEEPLQGRFVQRAQPPVNDDAGLEREADVMGGRAVGGAGAGGPQTAAPKEDEKVQGRFIQRAGLEEELPAQGRFVQRAEEEELPAQGRFVQRAEEEELPAQGRFVQRASPEEEEPLQGRFVQRAEEEEMLQERFVQRLEDEAAADGGKRKRDDAEAGPGPKRAKGS